MESRTQIRHAKECYIEISYKVMQIFKFEIRKFHRVLYG